jgi:eukaryotic-like serine/threonine-protein kinase
MNFKIGDTIGDYKIVASLGSGGMGEVFQAEHAVTRRIEAMKILVPDPASTPERDQRFLREIQLQARLNHPNIAIVHNAFWQDGSLIMIMELIEGHSLRSILERGKLPLSTALDYACQALQALDYAHAHGVVHRDISPSNMIVTASGTLKLTDFGLAKSQTDVRLTQTGTIVGSLYYTSPEQVQGHTAVDLRADIYSLGALLFEMVTGTKLFHCDKPFSLMQAHVEQPPPRASEVCPGLPPELDDVLLKALEKDRDKRFQSAELFRCALEGVEEKPHRAGCLLPAPFHLRIMSQPAEARTPELVPDNAAPRSRRNRRPKSGTGRAGRFRRRLVIYLEDNTVSGLGEARRSRDHGGYRNWAAQLRHLAGHLAGRTDLLQAGYLPNDIEAIADDRTQNQPQTGKVTKTPDKPVTD